jgi:hypothetical protein
MGKSVTSPRKYTEDTLELALNVLAQNGGRPTYASAALAQQHGINIPHQTLSEWKHNYHPDRYDQICTALQDQRAERMAARAEDVALAATDLELLLLDDLRATRHNLKPAEVAGAVRNVTTTKTLNVEKVINPLRNRPSRITAIRSADEILKALEAKTHNTINSSAQLISTEIEPASVSVGE